MTDTARTLTLASTAATDRNWATSWATAPSPFQGWPTPSPFPPRPGQ